MSSAIAAGAQPAQIAVLTRVNATIAPVQIALAAQGVPIATGVGSDFVERVGVRAALAWLRLALGRTLDAADLAEATRRPSRGFSPRVREWVSEQSSLERMLRLADRLTEAKDSARVTEFAGDIARMQALAAGGADTGTLFRVLVSEVGLGRAVASLDNNRHGMNRGAQNDDLVALRQIAALHPEPAGFDRWLRDALLTRPRCRRRRPLDGSPSQGPGVAARDRPHGAARSVPAPPGGGRRGGAAPVPRRHHAGPAPRHDRDRRRTEPVRRRVDERAASASSVRTSVTGAGHAAGGQTGGERSNIRCSTAVA